MAIKDNIIQEVLFQKLAPLAITKYWSLIQQCLLDALSGLYLVVLAHSASLSGASADFSAAIFATS